MKADLQDSIWYDLDVGVESNHFWGFPGSGKSNLGLHMADLCITETQDKLLLRGDRFAEWQHYLLKPAFKIHLVIPLEAKDKYRYLPYGSEKLFHKHNLTVTTEDSYLDIQKDPMTYFADHDIVVILDINFPLGQKGWFWANIFEALVNRMEYTDRAISFLDHEAGILLPEIALSELKDAKNHWKAVNRVCELFVDFRKALIRGILISQLEGEINWRIRQKCMFNIIKQGIAGRIMPKQVQKEAPRQRIDQFIVVVGKELYTRGNVAPKYPEVSPRLKMIPIAPIEIEEEEPTSDHTHGCNSCGHTWKARVSSPKRCPECKTTQKNIERIED